MTTFRAAAQILRGASFTTVAVPASMTRRVGVVAVARPPDPPLYGRNP